MCKCTLSTFKSMFCPFRNSQQVENEIFFLFFTFLPLWLFLEYFTFFGKSSFTLIVTLSFWQLLYILLRVSCSTCRQRCESLVYITNIVIYVVMRFDIPEGTSALTHVWEHSSVLFFLEMFKRFLLVMIFLDYGSCQRVYAVPFDC